jgi:hypothetical protein
LNCGLIPHGYLHSAKFVNLAAILDHGVIITDLKNQADRDEGQRDISKLLRMRAGEN